MLQKNSFNFFNLGLSFDILKGFEMGPNEPIFQWTLFSLLFVRLNVYTTFTTVFIPVEFLEPNFHSRTGVANLLDAHTPPNENNDNHENIFFSYRATQFYF